MQIYWKFLNIWKINLKKKILTYLTIGIGMIFKFVGVLLAKIMKFQLSFSMVLALVENIGETI